MREPFGLIEEAGDGLDITRDFAFAQVLAEIDFDGAGERGHGGVVNGVGEGRFDIAADGVEHDEGKADESGCDGSGKAQTFDKAEGDEEAEEIDEEAREIVVLARQRSVLDSFAGTLDVGEIGEGIVEGGEADGVQPAAVKGGAQLVAHEEEEGGGDISVAAEGGDGWLREEVTEFGVGVLAAQVAAEGADESNLQVDDVLPEFADFRGGPGE